MSWWKRWWLNIFFKRLIAPYANYTRNVHPTPNGLELMVVAVPVRTSLLNTTDPHAAAQAIADYAHSRVYSATLRRSKNGPNRGVLTLPSWSNN